MGQVTVEILCKIKYQEETEQGIEEIREEKLTKSKLSCKSTEARGADSVLFSSLVLSKGILKLFTRDLARAANSILKLLYCMQNAYVSLNVKLRKPMRSIITSSS